MPTLARISRTSSTLLCEAASSSMTSSEMPSVIPGGRVAGVAGLTVDAEVGAVQRLGDDARRRGLAGAPRAGEQVGVGYPFVLDLAGQRQGDVVLSDDVGEPLRPVLAIEGLVLHRADRNKGVSRTGGGPGNDRARTYQSRERAVVLMRSPRRNRSSTVQHEQRHAATDRPGSAHHVQGHVEIGGAAGQPPQRRSRPTPEAAIPLRRRA